MTKAKSTTKAKPERAVAAPVVPTLDDPLQDGAAPATAALGPYDQAVTAGEDLRRKPYAASGVIPTI